MAQWVECQPVSQRVAGSIPSQGTCLGCGPGPQVVGMQEATTHWCFSLSLSPSLLLSLKVNKIFLNIPVLGGPPLYIAKLLSKEVVQVLNPLSVVFWGKFSKNKIISHKLAFSLCSWYFSTFCYLQVFHLNVVKVINHFLCGCPVPYYSAQYRLASKPYHSNNTVQ